MTSTTMGFISIPVAAMQEDKIIVCEEKIPSQQQTHQDNIFESISGFVLEDDSEYDTDLTDLSSESERDNNKARKKKKRHTKRGDEKEMKKEQKKKRKKKRTSHTHNDNFWNSATSFFGFYNKALDRREMWDEFMSNYTKEKKNLKFQQAKHQKRLLMIDNMEAQSLGMSIEELEFYRSRMRDNIHDGFALIDNGFRITDVDTRNSVLYSERRNSVSFPDKVHSNEDVFKRFFSAPVVSPKSSSKKHLPSVVSRRKVSKPIEPPPLTEDPSMKTATAWTSLLSSSSTHENRPSTATTTSTVSKNSFWFPPLLKTASNNDNSTRTVTTIDYDEPSTSSWFHF